MGQKGNQKVCITHWVEQIWGRGEGREERKKKIEKKTSLKESKQFLGDANGWQFIMTV